jgi:hypothetical protein
MATLDYRELLKAAKDRLVVLESQRRAIDTEMAALEQTVRAFEPLVNAPELGSWGMPVRYISGSLTEAIRDALKNSDHPMEATEIRDVIVSCGIDLSGKSNAMANVHQTLRRLIAQNEVREISAIDATSSELGIETAHLKVRYQWIDEATQVQLRMLATPSRSSVLKRLHSRSTMPPPPPLTSPEEEQKRKK